MKKKILSLVMAVCMAATALTGCGQAKTEAEPENTASENTAPENELPEKVVFTYVTAPLNVPTIVEKEKGIFANALEETGIDVEYAELTSGADQTQALASGDVQVLYAVGATSVILSAANDADIKVLNMYSRSPKAFCLYSRNEKIASPEDLRGKTIACPTGTNLHELLVSYLKTADMTLEDVNYVDMTIPEAKAALDGESVDAALLAGATAYQAKQQGYHLVTDGEGLIDAIIAVAVTDEFYNQYPEVVEKIKSAQEEVAVFLKEHREEAMKLTAKALDLEVAAVEEMYEYYDFSTEITQEDKKGFQETADFMFEAGMIEKELDVNTLFYE